MTCLVWHIPEWLPWFSYKPLARVGRNLALEVLNAPIQFVKDSVVRRQIGFTHVSKLTCFG